jgi:hypothetical protein
LTVCENVGLGRKFGPKRERGRINKLRFGTCIMRG